MVPRQRIAQLSRLALAAGLLIFSTACANLSAVREFADISARSAEYTSLVGQYRDFPERQKRYVPGQMHAALDQESRRRAEHAGRLMLRHALIEEYMDAIGRLAADDLVAYDPEIDRLGKAVAEGRFAGERDAAAFGAVAKILFRAAADGWRRSRLVALIAESNTPFQEVVAALKQVVAQGFAGDVANAEIALSKHYQTLMRESSDKAGIAALAEWRDTRLSEVKARGAAVSAYAEVLARIAAGHQELYDRRGALDREETVRQMRRYAKDLRLLYDALRGG
jgi:hypothetical protein